MPIAMQRTQPRSKLTRTLVTLPLLVIPVLIYNIIAIAVGGSGTETAAAIGTSVIDMTMLSGARFILTWGDILLLLAIGLLFLEVVKATSTGSLTLANHMLSIGLFILCLLEFLLLANFATSAFFLLAGIVLIDALAGMWVTTVSARRDFGIDQGFNL